MVFYHYIWGHGVHWMRMRLWVTQWGVALVTNRKALIKRELLEEKWFGISVVPVSIPVPIKDTASQSLPCAFRGAVSRSFSTQHSRQPIPFIDIKGETYLSSCFGSISSRIIWLWDWAVPLLQNHRVKTEAVSLLGLRELPQGSNLDELVRTFLQDTKM